ncbi:hypothetical protein UlMin_032245 [Ulmus minor]
MYATNHLKSISFLFALLYTSNLKTMSKPTNFVLIHGSCHGGWSWYKLAALMKSSGHSVTALDLAASGIDPHRANEIRSISDYFKPLRDLMADLPRHEKVVLVGHSLGGLAISQAMELFPSRISVAVFVTALMPGPALNISVLNREDLALATMLMRPVPLFSEEDMSKELMLSNDKYGSVTRIYIISERDCVINKDTEGWMLKTNPPHEIIKISEADHMTMMSKPLELWDHLQGIVEKYVC